MTRSKTPIHVSLVAIPDVMLSTLSSIYDVLNCFGLVASFDHAVPEGNPFQVEIVALERGPIQTASGLPVAGQRTVDEIDRTDMVIIPSMMVEAGDWKAGRYPAMVNWLSAMHARGSLLCSACSGVLLLAETGLLDGLEATIHWAYARTFRRNFPKVHLRVDKVLVATGERQQFVMSGASASWHDLVLYLVDRQVGPAAALAISRFMLLQWHLDGQAPYTVFAPPVDHGDAAVLVAQEWLDDHFAVAAPVAAMVRRSGLPERSFKRRFRTATGLSPITYVQHLRIEEAKRRLERSAAPIDEIGWHVGYEDPAFFRRLFKRITRISPGAYRRKFRLPDFVVKAGSNKTAR
jgi:transcriptional regulator GlxA family with amidase domain